MNADLAITGASIRTQDPSRPRAEAIAIAKGRVVALGSESEIRPFVGAGTEWVDGSGMTLTPGLVDTHIHPFVGAQDTRGADLRSVRSIPQLEAAVRAAMDRSESGWMLGWGLAYDPFFDQPAHRKLLDSITGERPAFIRFFDQHTALANSSALALAGLHEARELKEAATVVVDADGPTGLLQEDAAMRLVGDLVPGLSPAEQAELYGERFRTLNQLGITGGHVMLGDPDLFTTCTGLETAGRLSVRLRVPLWQEPSSTDAAIERDLSLAKARGRLWRGGAAKFFLDGVIESETAWLHEPYASGETAGPLWRDIDRYRAVVRRFADAGFQCVTHAVGDATVSAALDALAPCPAPHEGMHRVEHIELLADQDLGRFSDQNVAASMQPLHMAGTDRLGESPWMAALNSPQSRRGFRTRDLLDAGAVLALGSDWPVADEDPRVGLAWARLGRTPGETTFTPRFPEQCLSGQEALDGYTTAAAAVDGGEYSGRLTVGSLADVTGFGADPVTCPADELPDLPICLTVVDGQVRHLLP